jgi:hypothetical protein
MMTALSINPLEQPLILRSHRTGQWHCSHDQVVSNLLDCTPVCVKDSVELLSDCKSHTAVHQPLRIDEFQSEPIHPVQSKSQL